MPERSGVRSGRSGGRVVGRARAQLRLLRDASTPFPESFDAQMRRWHRRYVAHICDFMLARAPDAQLADMPRFVAVLVGLVAHVFGLWASSDACATEADAWAALDMARHEAFVRALGSEPEPFVLADHAAFIAAFVGYLAVQGAVPARCADELTRQLASVAGAGTGVCGVRF